MEVVARPFLAILVVFIIFSTAYGWTDLNTVPDSDFSPEESYIKYKKIEDFEEIVTSKSFIESEKIVIPDIYFARTLSVLYAEFMHQFRRGYSIKLPEIKKKFFNGIFSARNGYFKDFSSLQMNNTAIEKHRINGHTVMTIPFQFLEFEAGYRNYSIEIGNTFQTGYIKVRAESNKIKVSLVWIHDRNNCYLGFHDLNFESIGGFQVSAEGIHSETVKLLSDWLISSYEEKFRKLVAKELKDNFSPLLPRFCDLDVFN